MSAIQPSFEVTIKNKPYKLVFTMESLNEAEELTGRALLAGLTKNDVERPRIGLVQAMFFAGLREHHSDISFGEAKKLITFKNLIEIWAKALEAYVDATTREDAEQPAGE